MQRIMKLALLAACAAVLGPGCDGDTGPQGPEGTAGRNGTDGSDALLFWESWGTGDFSAHDWVFDGPEWDVATENLQAPGSVSVWGTLNSFACNDPALTDGQHSTIMVGVTLPSPGVVAFRGRVSSERNWDWLAWYLDDTMLNAISGESSGIWADFTFPVPSGGHILKWAYIKDGSITSGADMGLVDDIRVFLPGGMGAPGFEGDAIGLPEGVALWSESGELPAK